MPIIKYLIASAQLLITVSNAATVVPYLETPTPTEITINWMTDDDGASTVTYGTQDTSLSSTATGTTHYVTSADESYYYHTVRLAGLNPDSYYYYKVESGNDESGVSRFRTQPVNGTRHGIYRVLVAGDHQMRNEHRYYTLLTRARATIEAKYGCLLEEAINLVVNDGDQVDVGTPDHYRNMHFAQSEPVSANVAIMTTVGNHETYGTPGISLYDDTYDYQDLSYQGVASGTDEYYAHQCADILFVHTDSELPNDTQTTWLRNLSAAAAADSSVDWVISVVHRPYQAEQYVGDISTWFRNTAMPILSSSGKHALNIGAHHHLYARGQVRDYPTYHIISGGTPWDQYWGQSTEEDMDDVTMTIANWAWQIVEFNLDEGTMSVDCYAEAHPLLGFVYNSVLIDHFERKLGQPSPDKPSLTNSFNATADTLPLTLQSSAFHSSGEASLYTTEFQVATSPDFSSGTVEIDKVRDIKDYYGDTGAPDYVPVDVNKGIDILQSEIPQYGLHNGIHYARVRLRDDNVQWSAWSDAASFTVAGSTDADPSISLDKHLYEDGSSVVVSYANGYGNEKDWIGIYREGQDPKNVSSQAYSYVNAGDLVNGSVSFGGLAGGYEYFAAFFSDDSYTEIAPRVYFYLGKMPSLSLDGALYDSGASVTVAYNGAPGNAKDWIGVYKMGDKPGSIGSTQWSYTPSTSGSATFDGLADGFYFAVFFVNDGYTEVCERKTFQIGATPSVVTTDGTRFEVGQSFTIHFANGAGTAKDYIGVFAKGATNLGSQGNELAAYQYVGGVANGSIEFTQALPKGQYFLSLFVNDSYTEISNRVTFGVGEDYVPDPSIALSASVFTQGDDITVTYANGPGLEKDWVGIYAAGATPGTDQSIDYQYVDAANLKSGMLTFDKDLPVGDYFAVFFTNDSYDEVAPRQSFSVVSTVPAILLDASRYDAGDPIVVTYTNGPGNEKDWVGLYKAGENPADVVSQSYQYVDSTSLGSGTLTFKVTLAPGDYYAAFFSDDSYTEIATRQSFTISGAGPALALDKTAYTVGDSIVVTYSNGPGLLNDWIGLYAADQTPGASSPSVAWSYVNADNASSGTVTLVNTLPAGSYYAAFFTNDGYTEVADRIAFTIGEAPKLFPGVVGGMGWEAYPNFYWSSWFGWYYHEQNADWYYQFGKLSWVYAAPGSTPENMVFWSWTQGLEAWCWTSATDYPDIWVWDASHGEAGYWLDLNKADF